MEPEKTARKPGDGERTARRGYLHQDRKSARLVYDALVDNTLTWVGLADREAGVVDDLVLGTADGLVAYQFKQAEEPTPIGFISLLLGTGQEVRRLADSHTVLRRQFPGLRLRLRYLQTRPASKNDVLIAGDPGSSTDSFLALCHVRSDWSLSEWRASKWAARIDELVASSGLGEADFECFWQDLEITLGDGAAHALDGELDGGREAQIEALAQRITSLIVDARGKDRWTRSELLGALGWRDRFVRRFLHQFPVGHYAQSNTESRNRLAAAIAQHDQGYLSLVGPPGMGKSTLLQREVRHQSDVHVVRYLAFVPTSQGQGRGEATWFLDDVNSQLASTGLDAVRLKDDTIAARQETFDRLLSAAGERHARDGGRWVIVVDGLDHVPREEKPERSFLTVLPLPQSLPKGVTIILGTQRLDLSDIPPAVRAEAGQPARKVDIAPLTAAAVSKMADALRLPDDTSRASVFEVCRGHPLVARYLIERLITCDELERKELLVGNYGFAGDLEQVYEAAWRSIADAGDVMRILALVAHAQGPIEPRVLALATSDVAVEQALVQVGHLLERSSAGWTVFHNSFRLFVRGKAILKFGEPDPFYAESAIYKRLAALTNDAGPTSAERWQAFRYNYLAGDTDAALALAGRSEFSAQYCAGRAIQDVRADIENAFRALKTRNDPAKLFDIMLAADEVSRRETVLVDAQSVVLALLVADDIEGAVTALRELGRSATHRWDVIDALLEKGDTARARMFFEEQHPFGNRERNVLFDHSSLPAHMKAWATRAIVLLDEDQLVDAVESGRQAVGVEEGSEGDAMALRFAIASAQSRLPQAVVADIAKRWEIEEGVPALLIEAADAALGRGDTEGCRTHLTVLASDGDVSSFRPSRCILGARLAAEAGMAALAQKLADQAPPSGLSETSTLSSQIGGVCTALALNVAVRARLGLPKLHFSVPEDRLLSGVQHHLLTMAEALGKVQSGHEPAEVGVRRMVAEAIRFLSAAKAHPGEDVMSAWRLPPAADVLGSVAFSLLRAAGDDGVEAGQIYDSEIASGKSAFQDWHGLRRRIAVECWRLGGDRELALQRLTVGLDHLVMSDPRSELEERAAYAVALGEIDCRERALAEIATLRTRALGVFLPAKKDGAYELWVDVLVRANAGGPGLRASRAEVALRFLDGLMRTEGDNMALRISRSFLFEAAAGDAATAWASAETAARTGAISWDGIVDAILCGVVVRDNSEDRRMARAALAAWSHLCLPWYGEPHASTNPTGRFLKCLFEGTPEREIGAFVDATCAAIEARARPAVRVRLLQTLQEVVGAREGGARVEEALCRWRQDVALRDEDERSSQYRGLKSLEGIVAALAAERALPDHHGASYELLRATARVVSQSALSEAKSFAAAEPEIAADQGVGAALIRVAISAADLDAARAFAARMGDPDKEGWGWSWSYGRLRHHEVRHLLGEDGAHAAAYAEFVDDMASGRQGVVEALWATDRIFPTIFQSVPWGDLWSALEPQMRASREFAVGRPPIEASAPIDDEALVARVLVWALRLPALALRSEAAACLSGLLAAGETEICELVAEDLCAGDGAQLMRGLALLTAAADHTHLAARFGPRLLALAAHPDAGVAAGAIRLAQHWGLDGKLKSEPLASFYTLHMPPSNAPEAGRPVDAKTRGLVIDTPLAWTDGWMDVIEGIADDAGVTSDQIRRRVAQVIGQLGGIKAFGHKASKTLELELHRIDLRLTYGRPQVEGVIRAIRHVLGELWRAERLKESEVDAWLRKLRSRLHLPLDIVAIERPVSITFPAMPISSLWGDRRETWLDEIAEDADEAQAGDLGLLAEWRRFEGRRREAQTIIASWRSIGVFGGEPDDLDAVLWSLPEVEFIDDATPQFTSSAACPAMCAIINTKDDLWEPGRLLVMCPYAAASLGWQANGSKPHIYYDEAGVEMARTIWWRDGLPQDIDVEGVHGEGQAVILSPAALALFEGRHGKLTRATLLWRSVQSPERSGGIGARFMRAD